MDKETLTQENNQNIYSTLSIETPPSKLLAKAESNNTSLQIREDRHMKLMELALTKGDIASVEKLVDLQNAFEQKQARKSFFSALSKFQSEIPIIKKKGTVGFDHKNGGTSTQYTFAKLEDIASAIKPHLVPNGLSYRYEQREDNQQITVICIITHADGHAEKTEMAALADNSGKKNLIQQKASTVSYLRRYTLTGALGLIVSDEDDDAVSAYVNTPISYEFYSDKAFNAQFEELKEKIVSGNKTKAHIFAIFKNAKVNLSAEQIDKINNIEIPGQQSTKDFMADLEDK